jgi:hypothetical protein
LRRKLIKGNIFNLSLNDSGNPRVILLFYMNKLTFLIVFFCFSSVAVWAKHYTYCGVIKDSVSGEPLIGAVVLDEDLGLRCFSNAMGFFSMQLDSGAHRISYAYLGYAPKEQIVSVKQNLRVEILMIAAPTRIAVVVIGKQFTRESTSLQSGKIDIPVRQLQAIPSILGESDPLKIAQMLPGIQSGGEATPGLFVRGSASDQNLVLIDDAPIYNPFHLFGIFSVVNSDAIKTFEITKGGYSSEYGGRLSSVVNMNLKEGNKNKVCGDISVGIAASKFLLETPLVKNKVSLMVSGRSSYAHLFAKAFMPKDQFGSYNFYDFNTKLSAEVNAKTKLYFSAMYSGDNFSLSDESIYNLKYYAKVNWGNLASSLKINHIVNHKLFWNTAILYSQYDLTTNVQEVNNSNAYYLQYKTNIEDKGIKSDFTYFLNNSNTLKFGCIANLKDYLPDAAIALNQSISSLNRRVKKYETLESAVYLENEFKIGNKLLGRAGARLNAYHYQNSSSLNTEPRLSLAYNFFDNWAIKSSYTQMHQYMHLLTTKGIGLPTDLWIPATNKVPYKYADQYTLSLVKDLPKSNLSISVEGYYKLIHNDVSFKEATSFMQSKDLSVMASDDLSWEDKITTGNSWNYGAEFFIQKKAGKFQGWVGYTLSWSISQFEQLNFGRSFYSRQDRRHNVSIVTIYQLTPKISLTMSWVYMTGNPITVANSVNYFFPLQLSYDYSGVNNFRLPAYHRLDIGINCKLSTNKIRSELEFSIYNVYNRQNPYFYYTLPVSYDTGVVFKINQVSVLPLVPSVNYKISL